MYINKKSLYIIYMVKDNIEIIQLKKLDYSGQQYSKLILQIKGDEINEYVVNALRRVAYNDIPTYALTDKSIDIEENTSIYDNDQMRLRISQIPIFNIKNKIVFLPRKYWENVDYSDIKREKMEGDNKKLELYLNVKNTTTKNMNVLSSSIKYYEDDNEIEDKFKKINPLLIIKLRPNESFKMRARAVLGIGENSDIWAGASNTYYDKIDENKFKFCMESQGQMDEYELLVKSCLIIKQKLKDVLKNITEEFNAKKYDAKKAIELELINEDHTIGNIVNNGLQEDEHIIFSGLKKTDMLIKNVIIKFKTSHKNPLFSFNRVIEKNLNLFDRLENKFRKLGGKYISI